MTYVLLVPRVVRKHRLVQAPGPGLTVVFLSFLVLAQGGGGGCCGPRFQVVSIVRGALAPQKYCSISASKFDFPFSLFFFLSYLPLAMIQSPFSTAPHVLKPHLCIIVMFTRCMHPVHSISKTFELLQWNHDCVFKPHFTQCQHCKPPFQMPPCPGNTFEPAPTPQTPFSTTSMPSNHISLSANTSNPLFKCPHDLKSHFTKCQHLKPPFQLPPCPQNTFHPVPTPQTPFSTAPMPAKHISHSAYTSNPLFNCPHARKTHFT